MIFAGMVEGDQSLGGQVRELQTEAVDAVLRQSAYSEKKKTTHEDQTETGNQTTESGNITKRFSE